MDFAGTADGHAKEQYGADRKNCSQVQLSKANAAAGSNYVQMLSGKLRPKHHQQMLLASVEWELTLNQNTAIKPEVRKI